MKMQSTPPKVVLAKVLFFVSLAKVQCMAQTLPSPSSPELPRHLLDAVVTIKTDRGAGSGFVAKFKDRIFIVTNQHVINGVKAAEIRTRTGETLRPSVFLGAFDADIALLGLADYPVTSPFFELGTSISAHANEGDAVIIPGNSLGDGVITTTPGKLMHLGPQRLEVDNPIFPGNSGSPIFHVQTGMVIGVLTEAETREVQRLDRVSRSSISSEDSQVKSETRYFGHRVDSVEEWGQFDWARFQGFSQYLLTAEFELENIEKFIFENGKEYQDFEDLHRVVNEAKKVFGSDKFADIEYIKTLDSLIQSLKNLTVRRVRHYKTNSNSFPKPFYVQSRSLADLVKRSESLDNEFQVLGRNLDLWKNRIQR